MYRLKITSNNKCNCGLKETSKHLILDYRLYRRERKALFKRVKEKFEVQRLTLPLLLYTKVGIEQLLVFLKETNIYTKNWYIKRNNESKEVEE